VTINNAAENTFLRALLPGGFWIGLNDRGWFNEGNFRWDGDASSSYRNWAPGEPNDGGFWGSENCVEMLGSGMWNDLACGRERNAMCERAD